LEQYLLAHTRNEIFLLPSASKAQAVASSWMNSGIITSALKADSEADQDSMDVFQRLQAGEDARLRRLSHMCTRIQSMFRCYKARQVRLERAAANKHRRTSEQPTLTRQQALSQAQHQPQIPVQR